MKLLSSGFEALPGAERELLGGILSGGQFGYLLLNQNPGGLKKSGRTHAVVCGQGLLVLQIFPWDQGETVLRVRENLLKKRELVLEGIQAGMRRTGGELLREDGAPWFRVRVLTVFPSLAAADTPELADPVLSDQGFVFRDQFPAPEDPAGWDRFLEESLVSSDLPLSGGAAAVDDHSCGPVLQWLDPSLDPASYAPAAEETPGADDALLEVLEDDRLARLLPSYWLGDPREELGKRLEQVNRFPKGDSRIIGCAGSGKSAVLLVKCFKAAQANPGRRFLILCFNRSLRASYQRQIVNRGLAADLELLPTGEDSVACMTFDALCQSLLTEIQNPEPDVQACLSLPDGSDERFQEIRREVREQLDRGTVSRRYYGIFIDEVQQFEPEWLRICYDLLENRDSGDHIFVLCGDITQKIRDLDVEATLVESSPEAGGDVRLEARIRAPWEADGGQRYPDFRFLNPDRTVRLDRNCRNCAEINDYLRNFARAAREQMKRNGMLPHPEEFPLGTAAGHGPGVCLFTLLARSNRGEAQAVIQLLRKLHDEEGIPYGEIAVVYYNKTHTRSNEKKRSRWQRDTGWGDSVYDLERPLREELNDLLGCGGYSWYGGWEDGVEDSGQGVTVLSCEGAAGLDRRAVILCGLLPLGEVDGRNELNSRCGTKDGDWMLSYFLEAILSNTRIQVAETAAGPVIQSGRDCCPNYLYTAEPAVTAAWENIHTLYMACSRAREALYIIMPETAERSAYVKLLQEACRPGGTDHQDAAT